MNGDESKLENQLRDATRSTPPAGAVRDAETVPLAEGWLALGQLLTAANADFRPEEALKQLRWRLLRQRLWRGGALLAAVLLVGLGITWYANRGAVNDSPSLSPNGTMVKSSYPPATGGTDAAIAPRATAASVAVEKSAVGSGWDQALDQQISQADESVHTSETLNSLEDNSIDELDRQLTSFRQEVEATSL